jgi:hypothetical protein
MHRSAMETILFDELDEGSPRMSNDHFKQDILACHLDRFRSRPTFHQVCNRSAHNHPLQHPDLCTGSLLRSVAWDDGIATQSFVRALQESLCKKRRTRITVESRRVSVCLSCSCVGPVYAAEGV